MTPPRAIVKPPMTDVPDHHRPTPRPRKDQP